MDYGLELIVKKVKRLRFQLVILFYLVNISRLQLGRIISDKRFLRSAFFLLKTTLNYIIILTLFFHGR